MADISKLTRLIGGIHRDVDFTSNTFVAQNVKLNLGGANTVTFAGTLTADRTITVPDAAVDLGHINSLVTLSGVAGGSLDLGTFTGAIISDNVTIKTALQELEAAIENIDITPDFLDTEFRISDDGDPTKKIAFEASALTTSTVRTISMPDADVDLSLVLSAIQADGTVAFTANQSMGGFRLTNLASPVNPGDAAPKSYVDAALAGLDFQPDVDAVVADANTTAPGVGLPAAALGQRYILESNTGTLNAAWGTIVGVGDNDIVEYDGTDWFVAYDVSAQGEGALVWDRDLNVFVRWDGVSWEEFGGLAGVTAGAGLIKTGNVLDIELDTDAGLEFDVPGDAGKLRARVDGVTIERHSGGLRVVAGGIDTNELADNGVTEAKLNASVAGNGLTGGGGSPLAVGANADGSIQVNADDIAVNSAPLFRRTAVAGEAFAANTTWLVRWAMDGETAGRIYKADNDAALEDNFYVIGIAFSSTSVAAGDSITLIPLGTHTLQSSDSSFAGADIGKPVFLDAAGAFTVTAPTTTNDAVVRVGMVQTTTSLWVQPEVIGVL